jgi:hypothetical protein
MIFGRHPAAWIGGVIQPVLFFFVTLGVLGEPQSAAIMGVLVIVGDLVVAGFTRDTVLAVIVGLFKALLVLLSSFAIELPNIGETPGTVVEGAILALLTSIVAFLQMSSTSPLRKFSLATQKDYAPAA